MKALFVAAVLGAGALLAQGASAQDATAHTALCKDGSYFDGTTHKGACRGHQGVKQWMDKTSADSKSTAATSDDTTTTKRHSRKKAADDATNAASSTAPAATTAATTGAAAAGAATGAAATTTEHAKHKAPTPAKDIAQKPGGGPGLVWVNSKSKVYHCNGDEWYGKTEEGSYMSESAAKTAGAHGSAGKDCTGK